MDQDADGAVTALYHMYYRPLVKLAALLAQDTNLAEELVRDSFVAMHSAWRRLADSDRALSFLYRSIVTRCRSQLRQRMAGGKSLPQLVPGMPAADPAAIIALAHPDLASALRALTPRQREVLILLYYADLPEAQTAAAMRISKSAVKSHAAAAVSSLRAELRGTGR
jgi:RNA polymerase sigma factor (sigma-70 family)